MCLLFLSNLLRHHLSVSVEIRYKPQKINKLPPLSLPILNIPDTNKNTHKQNKARSKKILYYYYTKGIYKKKKRFLVVDDLCKKKSLKVSLIFHSFVGFFRFEKEEYPQRTISWKKCWQKCNFKNKKRDAEARVFLRVISCVSRWKKATKVTKQNRNISLIKNQIVNKKQKDFLHHLVQEKISPKLTFLFPKNKSRRIFSHKKTGEIRKTQV